MAGPIFKAFQGLESWLMKFQYIPGIPGCVEPCTIDSLGELPWGSSHAFNDG